MYIARKICADTRAVETQRAQKPEMADAIQTTAEVVLAIVPCDSGRANTEVRGVVKEDGHFVDKKRANQLLSGAVDRELIARVYYGKYCYYVDPAKALDIIGAPAGPIASAASARKDEPLKLTQVNFECLTEDLEIIRKGTVSLICTSHIDGLSNCVAVIDAALLKNVESDNMFFINGVQVVTSLSDGCDW
jgi:hypothetical protein